MGFQNRFWSRPTGRWLPSYLQHGVALAPSSSIGNSVIFSPQAARVNDFHCGANGNQSLEGKEPCWPCQAHLRRHGCLDNPRQWCRERRARRLHHKTFACCSFFLDLLIIFAQFKSGGFNPSTSGPVNDGGLFSLFRSWPSQRSFQFFG